MENLYHTYVEVKNFYGVDIIMLVGWSPVCFCIGQITEGVWQQITCKILC